MRVTIPALWHTFRFILNLGFCLSGNLRTTLNISLIKLEIANLIGIASKKVHHNFTHLLLSLFYLSFSLKIRLNVRMFVSPAVKTCIIVGVDSPEVLFWDGHQGKMFNLTL